uniref:Uncharacterized protein n=1 Tax=Magallana gigas TaxID=29159 RepID=K1PMQ2_MAGGI
MKKVTIQKKNEMIKVKVAHYTLKEILKTADVVRNLKNSPLGIYLMLAPVCAAEHLKKN